MFHLQRWKKPALRLVTPRRLSSLRCPSQLHPFLKRSFPMNPVVNTMPKVSRHLSSVLDPKSLMNDANNELFNYTHGRFLTNEAYRLEERKRIFNIQGLFSIIAKEMGCNPEDIVGFEKLKEGGFNRVFLVTLNTGFQLLARIPYPRVTPKTYTVASEVATMDFLRSKGIPIPKVYGYSFTSQNEAETEYILMEYVQGIELSKIWFNLKTEQIFPFLVQLTKLEHAIMSIPFPAGGSIYYAKDLKALSGNEGIVLEEGPFSMGPDVSIPLWYGRREQLNVFRGPYKDAESVMVTGAKKELAYLEKFGTPRQPYERIRRQLYGFEKQSPLDHAKNLHRYLLLAPSLVPEDDSMNAFCIRHPDLSDRNIKVTMDSSGGIHITSLLDWQHTSVLPLFLKAGMPNFVDNEEDEVSRTMTSPKLPENFDELSEEEQEWERELFRRRYVHFFYVGTTASNNKINHKGLVYPLNYLRWNMYNNATWMWEGETIKLLAAVLDVAGEWESFSKDGAPCPVSFTDDEIIEAAELWRAQEKADIAGENLSEKVGYWDETWVPVSHYEKAKALSREAKQLVMKYFEDKGVTEEEYAILDANWSLEDLDEEEMEEYK